MEPPLITQARTQRVDHRKLAEDTWYGSPRAEKIVGLDQRMPLLAEV
ncbi:MAG: hypothetical protein ACRDQ0_08460 [Pseudonocardia sp.]